MDACLIAEIFINQHSKIVDSFLELSICQFWYFIETTGGRRISCKLFIFPILFVFLLLPNCISELLFSFRRASSFGANL